MAKDIKISDDDIKAIVDPDLDRAKAWQDDLRDIREQNLLLYSMSKDAEGISHLNRAGFSQVVAPLVYESVEGMKVGLDQLFTSPDFFAVKMGEDAEAGERVRKLLRWNIFEAQYGARNLRYWLDGALKYHYGVLKVFWDEEYKEERQTFAELDLASAEQLLQEGWKPQKWQEVTEDVPFLNPMGMGVETRPQIVGLRNVDAVKKDPIFIGPRLLAVDPETFFYTPDSDELDKCRLVAHKLYKTAEDIKRGEDAGSYRKGSYNRVLNGAGNDTQEEQNEDTSYRYDAEGLDVPDDTDVDTALSYVKPRQKVIVWEIYVRADLHGKGYTEPVIIHKTDSGVVLSIQKNAYGRPPFRIAKAIENPWQMEGKPYPKSLEQLQVEMTQQTRLWNDATADSVYGNLITSDDLLASNWVNRMLGGVILAHNSGTITNKAYDIIRGAQPDPSILKAMELLEGRGERISGVTRYNQGIDANSLNKTATGINIIASLSQQKQKYMATVISETWKDVLEDMVECFKLFGQPYIEYFARKGNEIVLSDYQNDFTISIELGIGPQEKQQQAAIIKEMIPLALQDITTGGSVLFGIEHLAKMIDRIGQLTGTPLESFHYSEKETQAKLQQKQMQAQAQQQQQMAMQAEMANQQTQLEGAKLGVEMAMEERRNQQALPYGMGENL